MGAESKTLTEEELFFYEDKVCGEADMVYRFCIALTLGIDSAQRLMEHVYRQAAKEINKLLQASTQELRIFLLRHAYDSYDKQKNSDIVSASPVVQVLKDLSVDERVVIVAKDVVGLTVSEITEVISSDNETIRKKLGHARKAILNFK